MNLTTATPVEIDTVLAAIHERRSDAYFEIQRWDREIKRILNDVEVNRHGRYEVGSYNHTSAMGSIDRYEDKIKAQYEIVYACDAESRPLEAEFTSRGGWTRAYKVLNNNGHIHTSMDCSTCFATTRFGWLPQVSGSTEANIVMLAGEGACTICYPSAPCVGPNTLYTPVEAAERAVRAAEKEARLSAKVAKSLSVDGSVVTLRWAGGYKELKTYRAAELFVTDSLAGTGYDHPSQEVIEEVLDLMATKKGVSVEEILIPLQIKADKKAKANAY